MVYFEPQCLIYTVIKAPKQERSLTLGIFRKIQKKKSISDIERKEKKNQLSP